MSLLLSCLGAAGFIAFVASLATAVALWLGRSAIHRRSVAAQARLLTSAALFPGLVTAMLMLAALAPLFGWITDHCLLSSASHAHPHICAHHVPALPSIPVIGLGLAFVSRLVWVLASRAVYAARASRLARALSASVPSQAEDVFELPSDAPEAFVVGSWSPKLFLSRGLTRGAYAPHHPAVLAHEQAHLRARHPQWRILAGVGAAFHVPMVARRIEAELSLTHELVADAMAAKQLGSSKAVARALICLTRSAAAPPGAALAFGGGDLERRVRTLLEPEGRSKHPQAGSFLVAFAALGFAAGARAHAIHHEVEHLLGLLSP